MFASLIIHTFQLIFSAGTMFFSHNKSAGTVFRLIFSAKRTGLTWNCLNDDVGRTMLLLLQNALSEAHISISGGRCFPLTEAGDPTDSMKWSFYFQRRSGRPLR